MLSLGAHWILFYHFEPSSKVLLSATSKIDDYHLPVSVELVHYAKTETQPTIAPHGDQNLRIDQKRGDIEKRVSNLKKWGMGPIQAPTQSFSPNANKKAALAFNKNELVSFTKAPSPSTKVWNRAPVYPESARRLGREGRVILDAELDESGKVVSVQVSRSSGSADLDQAAIEAVREWTMDLPKDGTRRIFIPITFRFNSSGS